MQLTSCAGCRTIDLLDTVYYECHYWEMTHLDSAITMQTCEEQCLQIVARNPHGRFYFWSRVNPTKWGFQGEEGFAWLHKYRIQPNDCTTLRSQFRTPQRRAIYACAALLSGALTAVAVLRRKRRGKLAAGVGASLSCDAQAVDVWCKQSL